jgi:hypothetical protein
MAEITTDSQQGAAGGEPTGAAAEPTPEAVAQPAVPAKKPPTTVLNGSGKTSGKGNATGPSNGSEPFMKRVQRATQSEVKKALGMSLDEAKAIIAKANSGAPAEPAAQIDSKQLIKLRQELDAAKRQIAANEQRYKKQLARKDDQRLESDLKFVAAQAGVVDADYALTLYARAVRGTADGAKPPAAAEFFQGLRTSHQFLFNAPPAAPAPVVTPVTTAPPESPAPGETKPTPAVAGTAPPPRTADKMSDQEFADYKRRQYGVAS